MIKVFYLFWTLLVAIAVTLVSFFYMQKGFLRGFPLGFYNTERQNSFIVLSFAVDLIFWWILFSILLVIIKNYIFDK